MAVSPSRSDAPVEPSGPGLRRTLSVWQAVGLSVAYHAKPAVRERADVACDRVDLSDILPLLGLRG